MLHLNELIINALAWEIQPGDRLLDIQQGRQIVLKDFQDGLRAGAAMDTTFGIACNMCGHCHPIRRNYLQDARSDVILKALDANFFICKDNLSLLCLDCSVMWEMSYEAVIDFLGLPQMKPIVHRILEDQHGVVFFNDEEHYRSFWDRNADGKEWAIFHEFAVKHERWKGIMEEVKRLSTVRTGLMYNR